MRKPCQRTVDTRSGSDLAVERMRFELKSSERGPETAQLLQHDETQWQAAATKTARRGSAVCALGRFVNVFKRRFIALRAPLCSNHKNVST